MRLLAHILVVTILLGTTVALHSQSLADVLRDNGIPSEGLKTKSLQQVVGNSASHSDAFRFTIAYYTVPEESSSLWIGSYDKQKHHWISKSFSRVSDIGSGATDVCFGSIEDLEFIGGDVIATTHLNPSAECTIVFSSSLDLKRTIYGWIVATTQNGISLIQHSEIHFAPTHPVELSVYDHARNTLVQVFPPKGDPFRSKFIRYLNDNRDLSWCEEFNSHCDPERFGADLGEVRAGIESNSFAFYITFSSAGYGANGLDEPELMYVFLRRGGTWEFREFPRESAPYALNDAVSRFSLAHIFGDK